MWGASRDSFRTKERSEGKRRGMRLVECNIKGFNKKRKETKEYMEEFDFIGITGRMIA